MNVFAIFILESASSPFKRETLFGTEILKRFALG